MLVRKFLLASAAFALAVILTATVAFAAIHPTSPTAVSSVSIEGLLNFTNKNRSTPLILDERLNRSAQAKCEDMVARNYWSHDAPDGTTPWVFIHKEVADYPGQKLGENLAEAINDSKSIVATWMSSAEHRTNIQNVAFHEVGFAICMSDSYIGNGGSPATIVVQHFAS